MSASLPAEITVETDRDGNTVYQFPVRTLGRLKWLAIFPIVFSIIVIGMIGSWIWGFVGGMIQIFGPWGALGGLFTLPFLLGIYTTLFYTACALAGRTQLIVREQDILTRERVGWFRRTRRVRRDAITHFHVQTSQSPEIDETAGFEAFLQQFCALSVKLAKDKSMVLVLAYPRDWLIAVAQDLSQRCGTETAAIDSVTRAIPVEVDEVSLTGVIEREKQPADSPIELQRLADGLVFTVPAPGVWKGSSGLFVFGLLWCGFMVVFTSLFAVAAANGKVEGEGSWWLFPLFIVVFWSIGIGLLLGAINMGRRQAAIAVTREHLKLIVSGLFGTTRREWALDELDTFRKGPSGMSVNDVPVMQLHIVPRKGSPYGLLTGRDEAELEWMATHLRRCLPEKLQV